MSLPTRPATGHATADERDARARDRRSTTTGARPQLPNRPRTAPAATHAVLSRHLRQSNGETFCVDPRLFVYVPAKKCSRRDCVFCGENHFHRGPACDCVRNRDAYTVSKDTDRIYQHQKWHLERNEKPAIGERILVKFQDEVWYKGTINAAVGLTVEGKDEWSVLFDDCTTGTFVTGEADVVISNQPQPREIDRKLETFFRRHTNGDVLLIKDVRARHAAILSIESDGIAMAGRRSSLNKRATSKTSDSSSISSSAWSSSERRSL